jgi:predicted negative regulator of RcsB-dependent stress response
MARVASTRRKVARKRMRIMGTVLEDYLSEKEQWERVVAWVRENGLWIVAGVIVGALGIAGWQWWNAHVDQVNSEASAKYEDLIADLGKGDQAGALALVGDLERDYGSTPYLDQGKLALVRVYVDTSQLDKAAATLQSVIAHTKDKQLALVARLRLARVQIAQKKPDDALTSLDGVDAGAFLALFHEVRGDAEFAKGNKAAALTEYRAARTSDMSAGGSGPGDTALLDLKIADLTAAAAAASRTAPTSATSTPAAQNQAAQNKTAQ